MSNNIILVVDDEKNARETLRQRLEFENFSVVIAIDGDDALKKIQKNSINLVLLDVMMPRINGYQVCRDLKENPATKNIPVILLTAKSQESDKFWGKEVGANDYVVKPYDMDELLEKINSYFTCV